MLCLARPITVSLLFYVSPYITLKARNVFISKNTECRLQYISRYGASSRCFITFPLYEEVKTSDPSENIENMVEEVDGNVSLIRLITTIQFQSVTEELLLQ